MTHRDTEAKAARAAAYQGHRMSVEEWREAMGYGRVVEMPEEERTAFDVVAEHVKAAGAGSAEQRALAEVTPDWDDQLKGPVSGYNAVEPPHYQRGPVVKGDIGSQITQGKGAWSYVVQCIDVMRAIRDPRLATAMKYLWRVGFGGKCEPDMDRASQRARDERDIRSAIWYLEDWVSHPTDHADGA